MGIAYRNTKIIQKKMSDQESATVVSKQTGQNVRKRQTSGPNRNNTNNSKSNVNTDNMWKFYSEDSPGVKIGPVPVLVISLMFIGSVFIMHIWGKYTRVTSPPNTNTSPPPPTPVDD